MTVKVRIVVHIGPMKTGTSAFAAELSVASRRGRLPPGVYYPVDDDWFPRDGRVIKHLELVELGRGQRLADDHSPVDRPVEQIRNRISALVARARASGIDSNIIFTAETIGRLSDPAVLRTSLLDLADGVCFVVAVRRPDIAIASLIGQAIRTWARSDEDSISLRRTRTDERRHLEHDYAHLIARWHDQSGTVPLILVPYLENDRGIVERILRTVSVPPITRVPNPGKPVHPSLSRSDLVLLARLKRQHRRCRNERTRADLRRRFDEVLAQAQASSRAAGHAPFRLTRREQLAWHRRSRPSIVALREYLGPIAEEPEWRAWFASL